MVNTVIYLFGFTLTFVIGLGATQIVDGIMSGLATNLEQGGIVVRLIGLVIDFFIAGIFVLFGILGRKRFRWSIIFGMVLYAIDGVILVLFKDFFGAAFHAWALFGIWGGLKSINELKLLEASGDIEAIEKMHNNCLRHKSPLYPQADTDSALLSRCYFTCYYGVFSYCWLATIARSLPITSASVQQLHPLGNRRDNSQRRFLRFRCCRYPLRENQRHRSAAV